MSRRLTAISLIIATVLVLQMPGTAEAGPLRAIARIITAPVRFIAHRRAERLEGHEHGGPLRGGCAGGACAR